MTTEQLVAAYPLGRLATVVAEEQRTYEIVGHWRGYVRLRNVSTATEAHYSPQDICAIWDEKTYAER